MHTLRSLAFAAAAFFCFTGTVNAQYSFHVDKQGHGPALVLLPGLDCSGQVWTATVDRYKDRYTCYSLTLPGFSGQPPIHSDTLLKTLAWEIARYIRSEHIQQPIIVGHSLGGWLALQVGIDDPALLKGIVCVSSSPFLPALSMGNDVALDSARNTGAMIKRYMSAQTQEQFRAGLPATLAFMIRDSANIRWVAKMAEGSDPATQGEAMYELFSTDLRPEMDRVHCPILVLGDWVAYKAYGATHDNVLDKYRSQFGKAPHVSIALNDTSKHFIMLDEPQWFYEQVDGFLSGL
jgi:N-formylmaleamate deformylase